LPTEDEKTEINENPAWRYRLGLMALAVLFVVTFFVSFQLGRYPVDPMTLIKVLGYSLQCIWASLGAALSGNTQAAYVPLPDGIDRAAVSVVMQIRLPRVICAVCVGAALSIAGASYQGLFQNPMVSQDILGASQGAAFGACLAFLFGLGATWITGLAFVFGLAAVFIAYTISKVSKVGSILALILSGMVVSSLFVSGTSFIKLIADTESVLPAITYWLMGSLASIRQGDALFAVPLLIVAAVPIIILRWRINLLATGDDEARSMGVNIQAMRLGIITCATFLSATCVAISGMIGWVGLVIPHFCRLIFGYDYRRIIPAAILMGGTFLLIVDDVARLMATSEVPIGILTGVIGAPVFIFLIMKGGVRSGRRG
jgi:iron complex transport system permease protein